MQTYKVRKGDTISGIAKQFQHKKWETIWQAPENKPLVSKRKKPDALQPGDQLTIPANEKQLADEKKEADRQANSATLRINGKTYMFEGKELDAFKKETLRVLKTAVDAIIYRVADARAKWEYCSDLSGGEAVMSWFMPAFGSRLPPESLIKAAESAQARVETALSSGDFKKITTELRNSSAPVNAAYSQMIAYQNSVISYGAKEVAVLEFTRDAAFGIAEAILTPELKGVSGALKAGALVGVLKSAETELGKYLSGTSTGKAAALRVLRDGALEAAQNAVGKVLKGKAGEKIIKGIAQAGAKQITGKIASKLGKRAEEFIAKRLEGMIGGALDAAVKDVCKVMTGKESPSDFYKDVAKEAGLGSVLNGLDPYFDKKLGPATADKLLSAGLKLSGKATKKDVVEIISDLAKEPAKWGIDQAIEEAVDQAKGDESADEIGNKSVDLFVDRNNAALQAEISKRLNQR